MKRAAIVLGAALCSTISFADEGYWYVPRGGWDVDVNPGEFYTLEDGKPPEVYTVRYDGISEDLEKKIESISNLATKRAYQALYEGLRAQVMVENMSDNLNALFAGGNASITSSDGTSDGSYSFGRGAGGAVTLTLSGVNTVEAGGGLEKSDGTMRLKNWLIASGYKKTLGDALSGDRDAQALIGGHEVLARSGPNGKLGYIKIGKVDGAGVAVDGSTISSNAQGRLEIKGWASEGAGKSDKAWVIPYARGAQGGVNWGNFGGFFSTGAFAFDDEVNEGLLYPRGWRGDETGPSLSSLLADPDAEGRDSHYVLARSGTGDGAVLAYLPIGDVMKGGMGVDGKSIVTNETADGSASVAGAATAAQGWIPRSDGSGGLSWDFAPPTVSWDGSTDTLTIATPGEDGRVDEVRMPRVSIEEEGTEDATEYTVTWRDLNEAESTETVISVPKRAEVAPDGESVVTNGGRVAVRGWAANKATKYAVPHAGGDALAWRGFGDFFDPSTFDWAEGTGRVAPKGYGAGVGNFHYFGTGANGNVGWWGLPNVTTNAVDGDEVTITSTTVGNVKTLGLKGWDPDYGGGFPLFLVNDHGALGYYPLPEPVTNEWDGASIASNDTGRIEIKGFATGTPRCDANLYSMLTNTATAYPEKAKHMLLSRYKDGSADPVLHWIPFPDGAMETGGREAGGAEADGVTIVTNTAQGAATQGRASIAGYSTASNGTVLTRTADGVEWRPAAATSGAFAYANGRIGPGAVTVGRQAYMVNTGGTAASGGSWRVKVELEQTGASPIITVESGSGFAPPPSPLVSYFPLYDLGDGEVVGDWRGTFVVPAYEQGSY